MNDPRLRCAVDGALLAVAALVATAAVLHTTPSIRVPLALLSAAVLPGAAVLTRLEVPDPATWLGLAVGISISVEAVASMVMIQAGWWHPSALLAALGLLSVAAIAVDLWSAGGPTRGGSPELPRGPAQLNRPAPGQWPGAQR